MDLFVMCATIVAVVAIIAIVAIVLHCIRMVNDVESCQSEESLESGENQEPSVSVVKSNGDGVESTRVVLTTFDNATPQDNEQDNGNAEEKFYDEDQFIVELNNKDSEDESIEEEVAEEIVEEEIQDNIVEEEPENNIIEEEIEDEQVTETEDNTNQTNEEFEMTNDNCTELEKKLDCLEQKNRELLERMERYEAKEKAEYEELSKRAQERELYNAMQRIADEKYKPTEQQLAEIEAKNRAAEFDKHVEEVFARMLELKKDEFSKVFENVMDENNDELYNFIISKMKEQYDPELIQSFVDQYDQMTIEEKVAPIVQMVREVTEEEYEEEKAKQRQAFSDAVDASLCKELCPNKDE